METHKGVTRIPLAMETIDGKTFFVRLDGSGTSKVFTMLEMKEKGGEAALQALLDAYLKWGTNAVLK